MNVALCIFALAVLAVAMLGVPWDRFRDTGFQHVFFGCCVATLFVWILRVGVVPALPIHLLCLTTVTLMFGWPLAIVAAAVLTIGIRLAGIEDWAALPGEFLALGVIPVAVSWQTFRMSRRYLPHNPFVYIFVCAFFGAAAAIVAGIMFNSVLLSGSGLVTRREIYDGYLSMLPLVVFPEAFINGMIITGLIVYRPEWVASFDDRVYLRG